jgi:hypothetical protein
MHEVTVRNGIELRELAERRRQSCHCIRHLLRVTPMIVLNALISLIEGLPEPVLLFDADFYIQ